MDIVVEGLHKTYVTKKKESYHALRGVSTTIQKGTCAAILGPSGSGKTTLLRCIAGLERPDKGRITIGDLVVFDSEKRIYIPPEHRGISMVFQTYALWPHMTIAENVAYPLKRMSPKPKDIRAKVTEALERVGCGHLLDRYPSQLSGGQQQRVAVARAIVGGAKVVLYDEPLSSVDARVREELRLDLRDLQKEMGFTSIYVTHDRSESAVLGDTIAVINEGNIAQHSTPEEIYDAPANSFVANFVGSYNEFPVKEIVDEKAAVYRTAIGDLHLGSSANGTYTGDRVAFRPEKVELREASAATGEENELRGRIQGLSYLGTHSEYIIEINRTRVVVNTNKTTSLSEGQDVVIAIAPKDLLLISE